MAENNTFDKLFQPSQLSTQISMPNPNIETNNYHAFMNQRSTEASKTIASSNYILERHTEKDNYPINHDIQQNIAGSYSGSSEKQSLYWPKPNCSQAVNSNEYVLDSNDWQYLPSSWNGASGGAIFNPQLCKQNHYGFSSLAENQQSKQNTKERRKSCNSNENTLLMCPPRVVLNEGDQKTRSFSTSVVASDMNFPTSNHSSHLINGTTNDLKELLQSTSLSHYSTAESTAYTHNVRFQPTVVYSEKQAVSENVFSDSCNYNSASSEEMINQSGKSQQYQSITNSMSASNSFKDRTLSTSSSLSETSHSTENLSNFLSEQNATTSPPMSQPHQGKHQPYESSIDYCFSPEKQSFRNSNSRNQGLEHRDRSYTCWIAGCGKMFSRIEEVNRHIRIHTGYRPFTCTVCFRTFSRSDHLQTHTRTHTGEKPYSCTICSKRFSRRDGCERHKKIHSKIKKRKTFEKSSS